MGLAYDRLLEALRTHGHKIQTLGRERARSSCPAHGGDDANLSIADGDQGVLLKCFSYDCPAEDVAKAVGLTLNDLFDKDGRAVYEYEGGHRVTRKRTRDGKRIVQQNKPEITHLYRHPLSQPIETWSGYVVLVEGEKCVDAAIRLGEPCVTTWPGGASNVGQVDLAPLGGKHVRIIADNDEAGLKAATRLVSRLSGIATIESVWTAPGPKESVDDIWVRGGTLAELVPAKLPKDEELEVEEDRPSRSLSLRKLSTVSSKRTRFLWDKMIPQSAVSIAAGRGGTGKSSFLIWLAARVNRGELPGELNGQQHAVLYVSHEDSLDEVVTPRADANGVDRDLFYSLGIASKELDGVVVPRLPEDLPIIRQAIKETGAKLLIIDPITSTLSGGDNDKMADVRMVMDPLNAMAAELGIAVIGIAHFRKGGGSQSDLISGSHAWRDSARAVMLFAKDEDAGNTVLTLEKINSGEAGKSFCYRLEVVDQLTDEGSLTEVARVVWEGDSATSVGDLVNHETERSKQGGLANDLLEFLRSFEGRALSADELVKHFAVDGTKPNTVRQNLKRMVQRGVIEQPAFGQYQAIISKSDTPRARGGVTSVTPVTLAANVTSVTGVTPTPAHAHARVIAEESNLCKVCGYPMARSLIEAGEDRHPNC